ncbi:MAG: hypothetical protein Q8867_10210 [Bacteroidota bacterium]|nr:hypothetical protein [Bacteroidota bacterium]
MNSQSKSFLIWLIAFFLTFTLAVFQRITGPTYEIHGKIAIGKDLIKYKLIRTYDGADGALISIKIPDTAIKGKITYQRFKSNDPWTVEPMQRTGNQLSGRLSHQPPTGKVAYQVTLAKDNQQYILNPEPAVLRYKSPIPKYVLLPHIVFIFLAMLFSVRTGFEAIFRSNKTYVYTWWTVITLFIGGLVFGPIVQKLSFGAYWTGWPFGHDLTDNKSIVAFIFWIIALWALHKNRENKFWPILASVILFIVFLIPHSLLGSEIDYSKQPQTEQTK